MRTLKVLTQIVAVVFTTALTALAGNDNSKTSLKKEGVSVKSDTTLSGSLSVDAVSTFAYRGVRLDNNYSTQPSLALKVPIAQNVLGFDTVSAVFSTTQSLQSKVPLSTWYWSNIETGLALAKDRFTLTTTYQYTHSPNDRFNQAQGVNIGVEYNDSTNGSCGTLGIPALYPHANVYVGLDGNLGGGTSSGTYYELGVAPRVQTKLATFTFPVNVGMGANNYYAKDVSRGYTSAGVVATKNLTERITLKTGATYYNTSSSVNKTDSNFWTTTVGLGFAL